MELDRLIAALNELPGVTVKQNEPLSRHTSFKIGGPVTALVTAESEDALKQSAELIKDFGQTPLVLGNGSNILAADTPIDRIVLKTAGTFDELRVEGCTITAQSGVLLSSLCRTALENALEGLEFAYGIPGTVGGAVCMNAGAYGSEMKDVIEYSEYLDADCEIKRIDNEAHGFSYRKSVFMKSGGIILRSGLKLRQGDAAEIRDKMETLIEKRRQSQPLNLPSAGSTFKRPKEGFAAALIDEAGLKGFAIGGAEVSAKHAGFIVNRGGASFNDVLSLIEHIKKTVMRVYGIELEPEIRIIR